MHNKVEYRTYNVCINVSIAETSTFVKYIDWFFLYISALCIVYLCVHMFPAAAFWGDIALDEDDLRMFKEAHSRDGARHTVRTNHTDSGIKAGIHLPIWL